MTSLPRKKISPQPSKTIEDARKLGCDESEEHFESALRKIVKHKPDEAKALKPTKKLGQ